MGTSNSLFELLTSVIVILRGISGFSETSGDVMVNTGPLVLCVNKKTETATKTINVTTEDIPKLDLGEGPLRCIGRRLER